MAIKFLNSIESITLPGTLTDYYIGGSGGGVASNALRIGSRTTGNTIAMELFHALNPVSLGISYSGGDALAFIDSVHSSFDSVLQFKTGGDERFRVGALNDNTFQIKPASAGNDISITDNSGNAILYSDTSTQRIGIGTTSPQQKLDTPNIIIGGSSIAASYRASATLMDNLGGTARFYSLGADNSTGGSYQFNSLSANASAGSGTVMTILNSGNVGIGTTSPSTKLDVAGTLRIAESGNTAFYGGDYVRLFGAQAFRFLNSGGSAIAQVSLTGNSYFNGGNVGIGTTGPNAKLKVEGNATTNGLSIKSAGNGGTYPFMVTWSGGNEGDVFCINNALNVGIGTLNPSKKLSVNGGIVAGNNNTDAGASQIYGDIRRPQATNFSKRNYVLTAGSSGALYSIARQWHDTANWGLGNINVIMWGIYYGRTNFSKADFSCRYGYSGNVADIEVNFNPGGLAVPGWTAATQVSGNIYYRDLQIQIPAYTQISFEIISPGLIQTYNVNNTANNTVYLYPH